MWLCEFKAAEGVLCAPGAISEYVNSEIFMREHRVSQVTPLEIWHLPHTRILYTTCGTRLQYQSSIS